MGLSAIASVSRLRAKGLALVLPGHYASERFAVEQLADRLQSELEVWASTDETDPVEFFSGK